MKHHKFTTSGACLLLASVLSGCSMFPSPANTITAPQSVTTQSLGAKSTANFIETFLPSGSKLLPPESPGGLEAIQKHDVNGDGIEEVIVTYRTGEKEKRPYIMLLRKQNGHWKKAWTYAGQGYEIDTVRFADITGNGVPELLVGWKMGASAGNGLDIFSWSNNTLHKLVSTDYHKLDIVRHERRELLAVWRKDTGNAYEVDILRWQNRDLVSDTEAYPSYFKKVAVYYEQRIQEMPDASFYWYYLADAQQKAQMPEQALQAARKGLSLRGKEGYPSSAQFNRIIIAALKDLGKYQEAEQFRKTARNK